MKARIRTIKPEALTDERLWDLEEATGLPLFRAFVGMWTQADREGRFEWRPRPLRAAVLPYWNGDFSACLDALKGAGFLAQYEADGKLLGVIPSFTRHQAINQREAKSTLPAPPPDLHVRAQPTHVHAQDSAPRGVNIPAELRAKVFARDGSACVRCGSDSDLTIDHIFPQCMGGTHAIQNLRVLCRPCNSGRPVQGLGLLEDLARDNLTMADQPRMCTHVHAHGEQNGTERNGTEQKGTRVADAAAPRTPAQVEDSAKVLGLARSPLPRLALVQAMATAYSERVLALTGKHWAGPSAIEAIGRGAPALANRNAAEHLDSLAAWAESDEDPLALFVRVLDGAAADEWVASKGLPLKSLAENPARWVSAIKAASKDGPQPPSDASKFRPMSREERRARMTGGAS